MVTKTTSFVFPSIETTMELSPLDLFVTTFSCIPWTVFYGYDISGEKLKDGLQKIAERYPVVCGRLKSKPEARVEIVVKPDAGFSLTETWSKLSLAEAVGQARVVEQPAAFPSLAPLPFFASQMVTAAMIDQDAPLLMVKLVHYSDGGSSLGVTVHHTVADAQRFAELMADMSVAYKGEELREVDHDRSWAWPDQLLKRIPNGMDPALLPRKIFTHDDDFPLSSFPEETYSTESIYIPTSAVDALRARLSSKLKQVEYVSQVDIVSAAVWMLDCETSVLRDAPVCLTTADDLNIHQTFFLFYVDLVANGSSFVPANFFGNAYVGTLATFPRTTSESEANMDLADTAAAVASALRRRVLKMRTPAAQIENCLNVYKELNELPPYPPIIGGVSSFYRMPFSRMDYGHGAPIFVYALPGYPFADVWGSVCPTGNGKGIIVNKIVRTRDRDTLINSQVLKELLPSYTVLSELNPIELKALLNLDIVEA